jgi:septal ring factor EnvC (AmiA/AmiB activator)|tara:strand:+ start:2373 stop:2780 length:408 start_codon:yes stop_codon:yes gene_type:complete
VKGLAIAGGLLLVSICINIVLMAKLDKSKIELQTAINNQAVLERTIQEQNDQIVKALESAKKTQAQIQSLNTQYSASQAQVTKLRSKFANFNLEGMAMTEPLILQGKVNRATARVIENFKILTSDEKTTDTDTTN